MSNNRPFKKNPHNTHTLKVSRLVFSLIERSLKVTLKMPKNHPNRGRDIYTGDRDQSPRMF